MLSARSLLLTLCVITLGASAASGCRERSSSRSPATSGQGDDDAYAGPRSEMVETQLKARDITDTRVLEAMSKVPRHRFIRADDERHAYDDRPLPIAHRQTISQPYIVALMTQLAAVKPGNRVLDIGTGSGYQAAVLAEVGAEVYSIEIIPELAEEARSRLAELGYDKVVVRAGDGYRGWPEHAPFAAIVLAAAAPQVPQPLIEQLAPGGRLVIPVGDDVQDLLVITKQPDGSTTQETITPVMFVPMTGEVRSASRPAR